MIDWGSILIPSSIQNLFSVIEIQEIQSGWSCLKVSGHVKEDDPLDGLHRESNTPK